VRLNVAGKNGLKDKVEGKGKIAPDQDDVTDAVVRVADLKSRAQRLERVRQEVKAKDDDVLRVYDHFKPGLPEIAALLPTAWAQRLLQWEQRRLARGLPAKSWPLKIGTHSVIGMLLLRMLASLKRVRRWGSRYAQEQSLIEDWLAAVRAGLQQSHRLHRGQRPHCPSRPQSPRQNGCP
jgi:indolepyruvate ferredoxin oxidoreductase beta subunit